METAITVAEQHEFNEISTALNLDAETRDLAEKLYHDFKSRAGPQQGEKLLITVNCAILISLKSQSLKKEADSGASPSINQIIGNLTHKTNNLSVEEFLVMLKQFTNTVPLPQEISKELKLIINKFAFSYTFYIKYQNLFKELELKETGHDSENYVTQLKNFVWLIYVNARDSILQHHIEIVEAVFLLIAALNNLLYYLPADVKISYCDKIGKSVYEPRSKKKNEEAVQGVVFELLSLTNSTFDDISSYKNILQNLLKKLLEERVIVNNNTEDVFEGIYDPKHLLSNLNRLSDYYEKNLGKDDIDERFFTHDNKQLTPGKFTPFTKQGHSNKLNINVSVMRDDGEFVQHSQKTFSSHKLTDFKMSEQIHLGSNLRDIRSSSKSIPASPFAQQVPATPMTIALQMYNWLSEKVKVKKSETGFPPTLDKYLLILGSKYAEEVTNRANTIIEHVLTPEKEKALNDHSQKKLKDKHNQILNLYFKIMEELLVHEDKKTKKSNYYEILKNENFHRALVACSVETVFFVNNSLDLSFTKLLELCKIQPFEFWRMIASFIKFDPKMPLPIKKHFYDLEVKILMHLVWKKGSIVHKLIEHFLEMQNSQSTEQNGARNSNSQNSQSDKSSVVTSAESNSQKEKMETEETQKFQLTHSQELFFKRVLHHTAFQVYQLCDLLKLDESISEHIWTTIKYILSSRTTLLIERYISQLILCCIYGVCKIFKNPIKFQEIITKYQESPFFNKEDFVEVVHQVYVSDHESVDLIKFYNNIFVVQMKSFLCSLAPQDPKQQDPKPVNTPSSKPLVPQLALESPLKEYIPQQILTSGIPTPDPKGLSSVLKARWTPQTKALYAFGESPCRALDAINKYSGKRPGELDDQELGANILRKHVKPSNSIMDKILEEKASNSGPIKQMPSKRNLFGTTPNTGQNEKKEEEIENKNLSNINSSSSSMVSTQEKSQTGLPSSQNNK